MEPDEVISKEEVRSYLDKSITAWRAIRDNSPAEEDQNSAGHYIDAYQNVRQSLLGEWLP